MRFRFCDEERKKTEERWVTYERGKIQSSGKGAGYLKNSQGERTSVKERREGGVKGNENTKKRRVKQFEDG